MPKGGKAKRHGNLSGKANPVYEALTREHPNWSKKKRAKIANAVKAGTVDHKRGRKKKG
jgi:hypothetical protein